jgi:hypothetical protein
VCRLPGPVDVAALETAVRALVGRHRALQCRFTWRGDRVALRWAGERVDEIRCAVIDRGELPPGPDAVESFVRSQIDRPFDVGDWPLLRFGVVRGDRPVFYLVMDHLVADGWSAFLAKAEIEALYAMACGGGPVPLPPAGDFFGYSAAQRQGYADGPELDAQVATFQDLLAGRPVHPPFPLDSAAWDLTTARYRRIALLDAAAAQAFVGGCWAARASPFMGVLAAYGVAIREATGRADAGVLVAMHNRDEELVQNVGWYANMLPLYFPTAGAEQFGDTLREVRRRLMALLKHHELPLSRVLDRMPAAYDDGAGDQVPTCFISFVDVRVATRAVTVAGEPAVEWERIEMAPAYRVGYGLWVVLDDDGLSAVTASPAVHGGDEALDGFESTLVDVLRRVAQR